jgi:multiple antibiotic resistance protein
MQATPSELVPALTLGGIFTAFFVMLGPTKIIGPFAALTREMDEATARKVALRAFAISLFAVLAGGFLGRSLLHRWQISIPAMLLAGGAILFIVGLRVVLEQYEAGRQAPPPLAAAPMAAAMRVTFPTIVTPYGMAALITLLATSHEDAHTAAIVGLLVLVMVLDLLAMVFARVLTGGPWALGLQILGAVLGVLQVALAVQIVLRALTELGLLKA